MTSTFSSSKTDQLLLRQTRMRFPDLGAAKVEIRPIEKGGSDRKFYRIQCSPEQTLILVKYDLERAENRHYVQIAQFLGAHGIRVPKIYFHDEQEGLIWIEDLGETDLWSFRDESWLVRRALYESALDEMVKLHRLPTSAAESIRNDLPAGFNTGLYLWEQNYFFENALARHFNVAERRWREIAALPVLHEIAVRLGNKKEILVHRDFQSQNVIVRNAQAYLIDFQGMRLGLAEYDVASLLFDPYMNLPATEREELMEYYRAAQVRNGHPVEEDFVETLRLCAVQRLMQALGAYGFLGIVNGNKQFLRFIPTAMKSLHGIIREIEGLEELDRAIASFAAT